MKKVLLLLFMTISILGTSCKKVYNTYYPNVGTSQEVTPTPTESTNVTAEEIKTSTWIVSGWYGYDNGATRIWKLKSNKDKVIVIDPVPSDIFWKYSVNSSIDAALVLSLSGKK